MSENIRKITSELQSLGFLTRVGTSPKGELVIFDYQIDVGSHKGRRVRVGLSMQGNEPYPEYPPHWIHISPPIDDGKGGVLEQYTDEAGDSWVALSRAPGPLWDRLLTKHMSGFLSDHFRRFWNDI